MSIETKMDYLVETKNEIKQAIRDQGTDVSDALPFRQYADKVRSIVTSVDGVDIHEIKRGENLLSNSYWLRKANIVNQDREDLYTTNAECHVLYTIDQWAIYTGDDGPDVQLGVKDGYLKYHHMPNSVASTNSWNSAFNTRAIVSEFGLRPGDQITFSMAYTVDAETYVQHDANDVVRTYVEFYVDGNVTFCEFSPSVALGNAQQVISSVTVEVPENCANAYMVCGLQVIANTADVFLYAAKLEKGSVQTLAHKENNKIVLDEPPPNYTLESLKCRQYYYRDTFSAFQTVCSGVSFRNDGGKISFRGNVTIGIKMRIIPLVVLLGQCKIISVVGKWESNVSGRNPAINNTSVDFQVDTTLDSPTNVDLYMPATLLGFGDSGLDVIFNARL